MLEERRDRAERVTASDIARPRRDRAAQPHTSSASRKVELRGRSRSSCPRSCRAAARPVTTRRTSLAATARSYAFRKGKGRLLAAERRLAPRLWPPVMARRLLLVVTLALAFPSAAAAGLASLDVSELPLGGSRSLSARATRPVPARGHPLAGIGKRRGADAVGGREVVAVAPVQKAITTRRTPAAPRARAARMAGRGAGLGGPRDRARGADERPRDPGPRADSAEPRLQGAVADDAAAGSPRLVARSGWLADETIVRGKPSYADALRMAHVHHTAGTNSYSRLQAPAVVRAIQLYHVKGNGWNDIGYNALVDRFGTVYEGRAGGVDRNVVGRARTRVQHRLVRDRGDGRLPHRRPAARRRRRARANARLAPRPGARRPAHDLQRDLVGQRALRRRHPRLPPRDLRPPRHGTRRPAPASGSTPASATSRDGSRRSGFRSSTRRSSPRTSPAGSASARRVSSALAWSVVVTDAAGTELARGEGTGAAVDWTWRPTAPVASRARAGAIETPGARPRRARSATTRDRPPCSSPPATASPGHDLAQRRRAGRHDDDRVHAHRRRERHRSVDRRGRRDRGRSSSRSAGGAPASARWHSTAAASPTGRTSSASRHRRPAGARRTIDVPVVDHPRARPRRALGHGAHSERRRAAATHVSIVVPLTRPGDASRSGSFATASGSRHRSRRPGRCRRARRDVGRHEAPRQGQRRHVHRLGRGDGRRRHRRGSSSRSLVDATAPRVRSCPPRRRVLRVSEPVTLTLRVNGARRTLRVAARGRRADPAHRAAADARRDRDGRRGEPHDAPPLTAAEGRRAAARVHSTRDSRPTVRARRDRVDPAAPRPVPPARRGARARAGHARRGVVSRPGGRLVVRRPLPGAPRDAGRAHRRGDGTDRCGRRARRGGEPRHGSRSSPGSTTAASSASSHPARRSRSSARSTRCAARSDAARRRRASTASSLRAARSRSRWSADVIGSANGTRIGITGLGVHVPARVVTNARPRRSTSTRRTSGSSSAPASASGGWPPTTRR